MAAALSPRLAALRDELVAATARMHEIVDAVDEAAWGARPAEGRWSVAECIEHLNMSARVMTPRIRDALREARNRGLTSRKPSYRLDLAGWFLTRSLEPPPRNRFKTTEAFMPPTIEPRPAVVRDFESLQDELLALLLDADGIALSRAKVTSPFNARLRYNVYSALRITAAHQRRHLWQAERTLETFSHRTR